MNRLTLLAFGAAIAAYGTISLPADPPVNLQATTPGIAQNGHINVSGQVIGRNFSASTSGSAAFTGLATATSGTATGGSFTTAANNGRGVYGGATSVTGFNYGGFFETASTNGKAIFGVANNSTGTTYGVHGRVASSAGRGVFGEATGTSGTNFGVYGRSVADTGRGVFGEATGGGVNYGGYFQSASATGRGLFGAALSSSGVNYGVYGRSSSPSGFGVYSEGNLAATGRGTFAGGVGVGTSNPAAPLHVVGTSWFQGDSTPLPANAGKGIAIGFSGDQGYIFGFDYGTFTPKNLILQNPGGNIGVGTTLAAAGRLNVDGGSGTAIYGTSTDGLGTYALSGTNAAVYGYSTADNGVDGRSLNSVGIYGQSYSSGGMWAVGPYIGLQANSTGSDAGRQAIRGDNNGSATGYAGLFYGNTWVVGTLTKSAGAFLIDHPLDPANKYLTHSFVESPDMKNIYDGTVVTDREGVAVVTMPDWFEALNKDFRYQLTVIGQFAQAIIAKELQDNQFVIRTDKPSVKVSWQVTGIRHDPYAEDNRLEVETDKPAKFRGKFIYPEGYGEPHSKSIAGNMTSLTPGVAKPLRRPTSSNTPSARPNRKAGGQGSR